MSRAIDIAAGTAPAFVHIDMDDLWAIGECYGIPIAEAEAHHVTLDALPRLHALFAELGIHSTFFIVGRDLESPQVVQLYQQLLSDGHQVGNHSWSHPLNFRNLAQDELLEQITRTQAIIRGNLDRQAVGFRAPGYGYSGRLIEVLSREGFAYDSSLMPGPYGSVFRFMDARMQRRATGGIVATTKTQYPRLRDTWNPLHPFPASGSGLLEIPVATSPLLRLPFQAGVSMRLGQRYFRTHLQAFRRRPALPLLFLLHAADIAGFSHASHPFFQQNPYFSMPVETKTEMLRSFLQQILEIRHVTTTETWLTRPKVDSNEIDAL